MTGFNRRSRFLCLCIALLFCIVSCDGDGGSSQNPSITSVTISPKTANVSAGQTQQFVATVQGTGNFDTTVTYSVNSVPGGNTTVGTISTTGLYTAPSTVPPNPVTVTATSAANTTKSDSAQVTVLSPALTAGLYTGLTSQTTGCNTTSHPMTACEIRFNITATLNQLSPSLRVDEVLTSGSRCPGGAIALATARCGTATRFVNVCTATVPITNGHWELHLPSVPGAGADDITADCAGQSCIGTYSATFSNGCQTGSLTWSATATTGSASAVASARPSKEETDLLSDMADAWGQIEVYDHGATVIIVDSEESE